MTAKKKKSLDNPLVTKVDPPVKKETKVKAEPKEEKVASEPEKPARKGLKFFNW